MLSFSVFVISCIGFPFFATCFLFVACFWSGHRRGGGAAVGVGGWHGWTARAGGGIHALSVSNALCLNFSFKPQLFFAAVILLVKCVHRFPCLRRYAVSVVSFFSRGIGMVEVAVAVVMVLVNDMSGLLKPAAASVFVGFHGLFGLECFFFCSVLAFLWGW